MRVVSPNVLGPDHADFPVLDALRTALLKGGGGIETVRRDVPQLIRRAIDEVIDAPRTGRFRLDQIEKTEKTYIGTKIEILIRQFFGFPKGLLDLCIDGQDVDIKNTIGNNWMIPNEAIGKPCVLIAADEKAAVCQFGLVVCRLEYLSVGTNRDAKRTIAREKFNNIMWLLVNQPYPANFWERIDSEIAKYVLLGTSANDRLVRLFEKVQKQQIHRDTIQAIAQQKDYMKRLRRNGGARDTLAARKIAVLSGVYDSSIAASLGLGSIARDEFVAIEATTPELETLLRRTGHID